jgi:hypothetical protein
MGYLEPDPPPGKNPVGARPGATAPAIDHFPFARKARSYEYPVGARPAGESDDNHAYPIRALGAFLRSTL